MPTAFLIEDSLWVRQDLTETLLEASGVRVVGEAETEDKAVEWLRERGREADIVILDLALAKGSGAGVLARLGDVAPHPCVVVLSNHVDREVRRRCAALGAAAVFSKSTEFAQFFEFCADPPECRGPAAA